MTNAPDTKPAAKMDRGRHVPKDGSDMPDRLFAGLLGLHRVCVFRLCRRYKRCLGPGVQCFEHHNGLARSRHSGKRWSKGLKP